MFLDVLEFRLTSSGNRQIILLINKTFICLKSNVVLQLQVKFRRSTNIRDLTALHLQDNDWLRGIAMDSATSLATPQSCCDHWELPGPNSGNCSFLACARPQQFFLSVFFLYPGYFYFGFQVFVLFLILGLLINFC